MKLGLPLLRFVVPVLKDGKKLDIFVTSKKQKSIYFIKRILFEKLWLLTLGTNIAKQTSTELWNNVKGLRTKEIWKKPSRKTGVIWWPSANLWSSSGITAHSEGKSRRKSFSMPSSIMKNGMKSISCQGNWNISNWSGSLAVMKISKRYLNMTLIRMELVNFMSKAKI